MKRLLATAATFAALATACAETGAGTLGPAPGGQPTSSPSASPGETPGSPAPTPTPARDVTYELWFTYEGSLFVTHRTEPFTPTVATRATELLLGGPTDEQRAAGVGSTINPGTVLHGITIEDGVATADLDGMFTDQETPAIAVGSLAQVVFTLTQFDSIRGVVFEVDGAPLTNFGGYELDGAQRRANFADQLPFILVRTPEIGDEVSSPVTIGGSADVFEAVVSIAIIDQRGEVIASTFTSATCGTGCRGTYTTDVRYDVDQTQPGTIQVYEVSAMDGSSIHVVNIPVTLTA